MTKFVGICQYDGTLFSGFQFQKNARSVQDELEKALKSFSNLSSRSPLLKNGVSSSLYDMNSTHQRIALFLARDSAVSSNSQMHMHKINLKNSRTTNSFRCPTTSICRARQRIYSLEKEGAMKGRRAPRGLTGAGRRGHGQSHLYAG